MMSTVKISVIAHLPEAAYAPATLESARYLNKQKTASNSVKRDAELLLSKARTNEPCLFQNTNVSM